MARYLHSLESKARNASSTTSSLPASHVTAQPECAPVQQPQPDTPFPLPTEPEPMPKPSCLQERIWNRAYDYSNDEEPKLVKAFEEIAFANIRRSETNTVSTDRIEDNETTNRKLTAHEIQTFVRDGIDRTKKEASFKQEIDHGLQAMNAVRGTIDRAARAAPEAAAVWAAFCIGIEVLSNPVTEALENRKGIQYVLCRMEWYWELAGLLLEKNKNETATVALREKLEMEITRLFQRLLLYQMRSICVHHRSQAATIFGDAFRIDNWADQLLSIKEAEEAVQRCSEQYNTQDVKMALQKLNDTADALRQSLQNIGTEIKHQAEFLQSIDSGTQVQTEWPRNIDIETQPQTKYLENMDKATRDLKIWLSGHGRDKDKQCLLDLYLTDPRINKKEIEEKNGGLLKDSYQWLLEHIEFRRFKNEREARILWIKGDPGKGKTMLLCGVINELERDPSVSLSYFFCQASGGSHLNTAISVLRGLIHDLVRQYPLLITRMREPYDYMGKKLFNETNYWHELCEIATSMLNDPTLQNPILVVDALDECSVDRQRLLEFITKPSLAKWIVSSRNWLDIEESMDNAKQKVKIHLEINQDSVSMSVESFILSKVDQLAQKKKYDDEMRTAVLEHLRANTKGNFLWVALSFPPGLDSLYGRMLEEISQTQDVKLCMAVLAKTLILYRNVTLQELHALVEPPESYEKQYVEEVIRSCGSFLTLHNNRVSFVHQSAKDYLLNKALGKILPLGAPHEHQMVLVRSLSLLGKTLKRDIYRLEAPGCSIDQALVPDPDPLAAIQYSCVFWIDHLRDSPAGVMVSENERVLGFFKEQYLQWLESLSLIHSIPAGIRAIEKLEAYLQEGPCHDLHNIVKDARRFLFSHAEIIEVAPLQVYASALVFSPTNSLIRQQFSQGELDWIELKPRVGENWNACLQTFEGHYDYVTSVVFSNDGQKLASGSEDKTVKIWDATSGTCLRTLWGHGGDVTSVVFSNDGQRLASGSDDKTIKVWDATSGVCLQTLEGHGERVLSVAFSNDGKRLASGSNDWRARIWDATSGACLQILDHFHCGSVRSVIFSNDGQRLVSGSEDTTIVIWDATSGVCLQTLEGHGGYVNSLVFSNDGQRLASGSDDETIKIWDATSGTCLQTLEGHTSWVRSVVFSDDGQRLASGSEDNSVRIWDTTSGACLQKLKGYDYWVSPVMFSNDRQRLASGLDDHSIKIWDATFATCLQTLDDHGRSVESVALSKDGQRLASGSEDKMIKIWDATSGMYLKILEGHENQVISVVFSNDGQRLASSSSDYTARIWDTASGACLQTLDGHDDLVASMTFSNDGQRLASGSNDETIKIWDATSGTCLRTLWGHGGDVTSVVFSNDGQRLASGSDDKTIKIWDVTSGVCLQTLEGHGKRVVSVAFSNDGKRLASGSGDMTVKIWDATSGICLQTLQLGRAIYLLSFDPVNDLLLSTEAGVININEPMLTSLSPNDQSSLIQSCIQGYGITSDGIWITKDGQKLLWLPPWYRISVSVLTISGTKVGLGCTSGSVLVMRFKSSGKDETPAT
ncbi:Vegetative incompatibility protein HET-E-1 [Ceratocystis lukuohia]|uniref:Mitochondrial division protein 1 n=1 Tax=Ceratocystis lukuohia TaxID=2019550 RepID=A0ABR4M9F1_9PEZI